MVPGWIWDPRKNAGNLRKHGIDFVDATRIFNGTIVERMDRRTGYGETRWIATGVMEGREIVVVYTERGDTRRMISARRATRHEHQTYWKRLSGR